MRRLAAGASRACALAAASALLLVTVAVCSSEQAVRAAEGPAPPCAPALSVEVRPLAPLVERVQGRLRLNFDFLMENRGVGPLGLHEIDLVVRDTAGAPILIKQVDHNGSAPGVAAVEAEAIPPGGQVTVFNPFSDFPASLPLAELDYTFTYRPSGGSAAGDLTCAVRVRPSPKRPFRVGLPLRGRMLAWDTHDFLSHHRRRSLNDEEALRTGRVENSSRYAYDFSLVDPSGSMFRKNGLANADWYGWSTPVLAVAGGTVVRVEDGQPDQDMARPRYPEEAIRADPWNEFGNSVLIDHGNGVYSLLAHLRRGSVAVRAGDRVEAGRMVGRMGASGAALTVHTHFQLQDSAAFVAEGVPASFDRFQRVRGAAVLDVRDDAIDSGEIVQSIGPVRPRR